MAPRRKFTRDSIIDAAFEVASAEGLEQITIRKVADQLGGSIAPIYVNFADVQELKDAVIRKLQTIASEMLAASYHPDPFLNIGIASIKFARAYSILYKELVMHNQAALGQVQPDPAILLQMMKQNPQLQPFTDEELMLILFKMQVFQIGLSMMDLNGLLPPGFTEEQLIEMLRSTGQDVILAARAGKLGGLE